MEKDSPNVRLYEDLRSIEPEREDSSGSSLAYAGECPERIRTVRYPAVEPLAHELCNSLQSKGTTVVTEALPHSQDFSEFGLSQAVNIREPREELIVFCKDAIRLRLLQHDFRNEDMIRIGRFPPGKFATALPEVIFNGFPKIGYRCFAERGGFHFSCWFFHYPHFHRQGGRVCSPTYRSMPKNSREGSSFLMRSCEIPWPLGVQLQLGYDA